MTIRDSALRSLLVTLPSYGFYFLVLELGHRVVIESSNRGSWRWVLLVYAAAGLLGCLIGCRMYRSLRVLVGSVAACSVPCLTGMYSQGYTLLAILVPLCLALNATKGVLFVSYLDSPETNSARRRRQEYAMSFVVCAEMAVVVAGVFLSPVK